MPYIAVTALSHPGAVRAQNEDSLAVGPWTICTGTTENPQTLVFPLGTPLAVVVADGLGGHPGGDIASSVVVNEIAQAGATVADEETLFALVDACNDRVYALANRNPALTAMGTTAAGVVVMPDRVLAFNVGDSRVYAASPHGLEQVSVDDRPPVEAGERTSTVTQCLGGQLGAAPVHPHVSTRTLSVPAHYLVCTDGLSDVVPADVLAEIVTAHQDGRAAFELWRAAMEGGGPDNITLALVRIAE